VSYQFISVYKNTFPSDTYKTPITVTPPILNNF